jgi:hypothetical protein
MDLSAQTRRLERQLLDTREQDFVHSPLPLEIIAAVLE